VLATAASMSMAAPAMAGTVQVKRGQTLSQIAARHGTSVTRLARMNHLSDPNLIVAGQRLRVPGSGGGGGGSRTSHTVRAGETLSEIAARYGSSIAAISRANNIDNPNYIFAGEHLTIPNGGGGGGGGAKVSGSVTPMPAATSVGASLQRHASAHGVDPSLVKAVAWQESGWRQSARSSVGAIGVMQVMPGTADYVNSALGHGDLNVRKMDDNVHLGVAYLRHMLQTTSSRRRALAAYYSGPGNVKGRLKGYQKTYVRSVLALRNRFR
jgi:soluble lytic murein transglycosylase-like protein